MHAKIFINVTGKITKFLIRNDRKTKTRKLIFCWGALPPPEPPTKDLPWTFWGQRRPPESRCKGKESEVWGVHSYLQGQRWFKGMCWGGGGQSDQFDCQCTRTQFLEHLKNDSGSRFRGSEPGLLLFLISRYTCKNSLDSRCMQLYVRKNKNCIH